MYDDHNNTRKEEIQMDFIDQLKQFSKRVESLKDTIQTEEATKTSILMPFFQLMGFDVFNPNEFIPEFTADVGIKKGEKVDYAILRDGKPIILIEAKAVNETLEKHDSQLFRYFGTTQAKFAILTNGIIYRFYTDLDEPNKMDENPFMEINILDIKDTQVSELKKFHKANFDLDEVLSAASELKYSNEIKSQFQYDLTNPSDEFVRFFISNIYSGRVTQQIVDKFRPIVKKALNQYISETLNDKIKNALSTSNSEDEIKAEENVKTEKTVLPKKESKIVTTQQEFEAYFIVKNLLKDIVPVDDITMKDTESYFNILYKGNTRKWICRLILTDNQKTMIYLDENKNIQKISLESIYDIEKHVDILKSVLSRFIQ